MVDCFERPSNSARPTKKDMLKCDKPGPHWISPCSNCKTGFVIKLNLETIKSSELIKILNLRFLFFYVTRRSLHSHCFSKQTPSGLRRTEGKKNGYFSAFSPQYFSEDFPELVRASLAGPLSPTDFSDGLPMD